MAYHLENAQILLRATAIAAGALVCSVTATVRAQEVAVTDHQIQQLAIEVVEVKKTELEPVAVLSATVVPSWDSHVVTTAPFSGTVAEMLVLPGQAIQKGTPVAKITSRELLETESKLAQAEAELQMADAIARRKRLLADKKFQSPVVADEAEAHVTKLRAVIEQIKRTKSMAEITILGDGVYVLPAPASGHIVETHVSPGKMIEAMAPIVSVETGDKLWLDIQVPASLVSRINYGDPVRVTGGPTAKIISISTMVDTLTRSVSVIAEVSPGSNLLHGQMVSVTLMRPSSAGAFKIPSSAVTRINNKTAIFVRKQNGFELKPVEVRGRSLKDATVTGDIEQSVQVAASGLPQLEQMMAAD